MTTPLEHLIEEARRSVLAMDHERAYQGGLVERLADALESTLAELRQERERARDAEERMRLLDQANDEEIDRTDKAEAALSRAEATIEKVRETVDPPKPFELGKSMMRSFDRMIGDLRRILSDYDKAKEADRDQP